MSTFEPKSGAMRALMPRSGSARASSRRRWAPVATAVLAVVALLGAACGDTNGSEISAGAPQTSSAMGTDRDSAASTEDRTGEDDAGESVVEVPSEDDPSADGETSSASSGDEDGTASSRDGGTSAGDHDDADDDHASDLDDAVSNSNDGGQASGGPSDSTDEQPVVMPDGTETFGPQEGEREQAEIIDVQPVVRESWPLQLAVIISGELRDGCQELAWEMRPDGASFHITVWQVVPLSSTEMACTMATVPFETQIELGTSETDDFTVTVNGLAYGSQSDETQAQQAAEAGGPQSHGMQDGERGHARIDGVRKVVRESWPLQLAVVITGSMRDGCQDLAGR